MRNKKIWSCLKALGVAVSLLSTSVSQATPINGNPTTGLIGPASTIFFNEVILPDNTPLTNEYAGLGVSSFSGFFFNPCTTCVQTPPSGSDPDIGNFANNNTSIFTGLQAIEFTSALNGAAFQFASNGGPFTFTALLGGTIVEQFTGNGNAWGYYGFSNVTLDEIQILSPSAMLIDNLQLGSAVAVPVPAPLALLGIGLLGLAASRRKSAKGQSA